ncbi:methylated-DNA--[protein]-cysteine S-methyltransferase [Erythrobacteraceae bacterium CFH 75059]|uniref:bifunctional transcriptional activator/DNA repair enzyme AdaA n=1 Tax=Qipengyuania thermophila TaxID=2509361 RepID=UPI00102299C4|nr:methylated-DNA--[protein]-cysteine S-methyltransferase [Qipengyuania thermophila]TCD06314.1 methylated-DNA--[protein]-cysteine S-methyltransferase [Erythrobacteraceae bacterium CFH 75059]
MSEDNPLDEARAWQAVLDRDRSFDGRFVTGVLTTGIYCRPSCAARHPKRGNVRFFRHGAAARAAGLRPCRRCSPDSLAGDEAAVLAVVTALNAGGVARLADLAALTGYSPAHLQRVFTRATGLSPAAYARALREERARTALSGAARVTDAVYDAGYAAPSRFYAETKTRLGMAPDTWRKGGAGEVIRWAVLATTLGPVLIAATERGVCRIAFGEDREDLVRRFPAADLRPADGSLRDLLGRVLDAVERPGAGEHIPLDVQGTAFQQRVWAALRTIPPGETRSYGELAAMIGAPGAARAVGRANGANGVAVLIPCHRVVQGNGALGGYAYGLALKEELLRREREERG